MNILTLPTELLDLIFSHCTTSVNGKGSRDTKPLFNACLVCCRWYEVARPYLYDDIRLNVRSVQLRYLFRTFKANPQLACSVKELSIECAPYSKDTIDQWATASTPEQWMLWIRDFIQD